MIRLSSLIILLLWLSSPALAQEKLPKKRTAVIQVVNDSFPSSLRGLSVVNNEVVWVSGSNGVVGRSANAGKNWKWITVKGFEKTEFRDIEAFDASTAIIMGVGEPAFILKTIDGGDSWKLVYQNDTKGIFLDAMEFWNDENGTIVGDPIDGHFFMIKTANSGDSWEEIPIDKRPEAAEGEACFAASGTNIRALDRDDYVFISGGTSSRIFTRNKARSLPIIQGKETTGANSVAVYDNHKLNGGRFLAVVGGDFMAPSDTTANCFISSDGAETWERPAIPPHGYRSCIEYLSKDDIMSCGLTGVDYSRDNGRHWQLVSSIPFHVCKIAKRGSAVYLAGPNGRIAKVKWVKDKKS